MKFIKFSSIAFFFISSAIYSQNNTQNNTEEYYENALKNEGEYQSELSEKTNRRREQINRDILRMSTQKKGRAALCHTKKTLEKIDCAENDVLRQCIFLISEIKSNDEKIALLESEKLTSQKDRLSTIIALEEEYQKRNDEFKRIIKENNCFEKCPVLKEGSRDECDEEL